MAAQRLGSARDMVGRKREYETIYILRPDSTNDVIAQVNTKVRGLIETGGGNLLKIDNWGKRKLAYEVQKQLKGIYLFFSYLGTAGLVEELEQQQRKRRAETGTRSVPWAAASSASSVEMRRSRSTTRTPVSSSTSSPTAASSCRAACRATARSISARSRPR